jgi:hypothetical protein
MNFIKKSEHKYTFSFRLIVIPTIGGYEVSEANLKVILKHDKGFLLSSK